jgi:hypothetical protein
MQIICVLTTSILCDFAHTFLPHIILWRSDELDQLLAVGKKILEQLADFSCMLKLTLSLPKDKQRKISPATCERAIARY